MPGIDETRTFRPLNIAVLTVSDTRTPATDTSGELLADRLTAAGHKLAARALVKDEVAAIRGQVERWIADPKIDAVITTGGTGLTGRDVTPEALRPLFEKEIDGFSAVFHQLSYGTVGTSTMASRACAGLVRGTLIFCIPGSTGACKDAWDGIFKFQLDSRHRPCNLVELLPRLEEHRR
jgi:molybdenum cofactor biosynthesis protein B